MRQFLHKYVLILAWVQALVATLGSLYLSEVSKFSPCVLCWYQRIMMYPLVFILAIGIARKDKSVHLYVLPLSIIGILISTYHNLLYYGFLPKAAVPCIQGTSCTTKYFAYFGFITIPFLSFMAFLLITICCLIFMKLNRKETKK